MVIPVVRTEGSSNLAGSGPSYPATPSPHPMSLINTISPKSPTMAPLMAPPISSQSPPFSPEQLLAFPLLTPPHALPSCFNFAGLSTDCRDRTSSKKTQNHDAIALQSLVKTDDSIVATFRSFVRSMSPAVSFPTSLRLPVHGRSMNSQGDVTSYLDFQVIAASWETFLQMMPVQRTYDPLTARQHPIEVCSTFSHPYQGYI